MKKIIDIKDSIVQDLKILAVGRNVDFKNYIQYLLQDEVEESVLRHQNVNEKSSWKHLKPALDVFKKLKLHKSKLSFKVFTEGHFVYEIKSDGCTHEIMVINENMDFYDKMKISQILSKTPRYYSHRVFYNDLNKDNEQLFCFRISDTDEWKKRFN